MSETTLEEKMAALQAKFKDQLLERYESIAQPWQQYLANNEHKALIDAHMAAHKMAGSAATFGFSEISKLAKQSELLMDPAIPAGTTPLDTTSCSEITDMLTAMKQLVEAD